MQKSLNMKKLTLIAVLAFAGTGNAQTETVSTLPTAKGNWIIGGSTNLGFNSNKVTQKSGDYSVDGQKNFTFNVTPTVGYFVIDNLAVGLDLGYEVKKYDEYLGFEEKMKVTASTFSVLPSATYYFKTDSKAFPYVGAGAGYALNSSKTETIAPYKTNFFQLKAKAGLAYFITPSIAVDLAFSYDQLSTKFNETQMIRENKVIFKNFGANIGINVVL